MSVCLSVVDEVCPLSDCLPLAGMSCTERLSRVSIPSDVCLNCTEQISGAIHQAPVALGVHGLSYKKVQNSASICIKYDGF